MDFCRLLKGEKVCSIKTGKIGTVVFVGSCKGEDPEYGDYGYLSVCVDFEDGIREFYRSGDEDKLEKA